MPAENMPALTPAELAEKAALRVFNQPDHYTRSTEDSMILSELEKAAATLDLVDKPYWVESSRSLSIPYRFEKDEKVNVINFDKLSFHGIFACYSKVAIGRIIGAKTIHALCLTFHEATLLPYLESIPDEHLLYVPVHAVDEMTQTSH